MEIDPGGFSIERNVKCTVQKYYARGVELRNHFMYVVCFGYTCSSLRGGRTAPDALKCHRHSDTEADCSSSNRSATTGSIAHLFFGCRHEKKDFLYRNTLKGFEADGTLTRLHTAFSRDQEEKVYVMSCMRKFGAELARLIVRDCAYVYVCGDGARMARDVHKAFLEILVSNAGLTTEKASDLLRELSKRGRYLEDVWS